MNPALQSILDILDEGLLLYRRGFVGFILIAASWLVPVAIGIGLSIAAAQLLGEAAVFLIIMGWLLLTLPLGLYLIAGLSRATLAVQRGHTISLRAALAINPLQIAGMGCYGLVFYIITNIIASMLSLLCFCPLYIAMIALFGGIGSALDTTGGLGAGLAVLLGMLVALLFVLFYGLSLVLSGATGSALVYGLQPFVQAQVPLGTAIQRSIDLVFYRFARNLLAFVLASAIFGATAIAVSVAIGTLLPLPLLLALGEESPIAQGVSVSAWLLGLIVVLPPLPIWMALLYQRNLAAWQGNDLAERIASIQPETSA